MVLRRAFAILISSILLFGTAACSSSGGSTPAPAPSLSSASATGRELATQFMTLLQNQDTAGLDSFLAPAFQLQRADGSGAAKADYLTKLPTIKSFTLGPDVECAQGDVDDSTWACSTLVATMSLFSHLTNRSNGFGKLLRRIGSAPIS